MARERIGIAILGAGGIAGAHLQALNTLPEGRLVATCDLDAARARARAAEFGAEHFFTTWEETLACPGVDAVIVCLPNALHRDAVVEAARAGKHVLVEKPMATTLADASAMVEAAEAAGVTLMVGQVLRFYAANRLARQFLREGRIGRPRNLLRRRLGVFHDWVAWAKDPALCGGITLYGFGSHEVDMMLWLTDSRATRVYAEGEQIHPVWRDYDDVSLQMRLANGCMAALQLSTNCAETVWDCLVIGDEGTLAVGSDWVSVNGERTAAPIGPAGGMTAQLAEFLAAINEGREPEASGRQVRDTTMAALEAARRSLASHAVEAVTLE